MKKQIAICWASCLFGVGCAFAAVEIDLAERDGFDLTNRLITVRLAQTSTEKRIGLRLNDISGACVSRLHQDVAGDGSYRFDTAQAGSLPSGNWYAATVSVVDSDEPAAIGRDVASVDFRLATAGAWFSSSPSADDIGGVWEERPTVRGDAFVLEGDTVCRFSAAAARNDTTRSATTLSFEGGYRAADLDEILVSYENAAPLAALTVQDIGDGTLQWVGLVDESGLPAFRALEGPTPTTNTLWTCLQEVDRTGERTRVSYLVASAGQAATRLHDADGNVWFDTAGTAPETRRLTLGGEARVTAVAGTFYDTATVVADGARCISATEAAQVHTNLTLLTNATVGPSDTVDCLVATNGFSLQAAAELVCIPQEADILRLCTEARAAHEAIAYDRLRESAGYDFTNRFVTVDVSRVLDHFAQGQHGLKLSVETLQGTFVTACEQPLLGAGTYSFDVGSLHPGETYRYTIELVRSDGTGYPQSATTQGSFATVRAGDWFSANAADDTAEGGAWLEKPLRVDGVYRVPDGQTRQFVATTPQDGHLTITSQITLSDPLLPQDLPYIATQHVESASVAALTFIEKADGTYAWCGLARQDDTVRFTELIGDSPMPDATVTVTEEVDLSGTATKVSYLVQTATGTTRLTDEAGNEWFDSPVNATTLKAARYDGPVDVAALLGHRMDGAVALVGDTGYTTLADALRHSSGQPVVLQTHATFTPFGRGSWRVSGAYDLKIIQSPFFRTTWENGVLTVTPTAGTLLLIQ